MAELGAKAAEAEALRGSLEEARAKLVEAHSAADAVRAERAEAARALGAKEKELEAAQVGVSQAFMVPA